MSSTRPRTLQRGFAMISAVFLLVVLSLLGVGMAVISSFQQRQSALDFESARALQAARAGIEWGLLQTLQGATAPPCFASPTQFSPGGALSSLVVSVSCAQTSDTDGDTNLSFYTLAATACNQPVGGACPNPAPSATYVERALSVTAAR